MADTWVIFDPHCATAGASVVARNFKSVAAAEKWLAKRVADDEPGYVGCIVVPTNQLPVWGVYPKKKAKP